MDGIMYHHELIESGRWESMSFADKMANIGSEVSRAARWSRKGNNEKKIEALYRGLELIDATVESVESPKKRELLRAREVLCDYFAGDNSYGSDSESLMRYFDIFAYKRSLEKNAG